jgi:hypothetical protein
VENDTVTYQIPDGFRVEAMPAPAEIKTDFGHYRCNAVLKDRSIQLVRQLQIYKTNAMPARYNEFRDFLEKVAALDNAKCVLIKE